MRLLLALCIFALPILDIVVTAQLAEASGISVWWVLAASALVGVMMLRHERTYFRARFMSALTSASAHEPHPWRAVINSGRKVVAGLLLLLPGAMSDVLAFTIMLIPLNVAARLLPAWATSTMRPTAAGADSRVYDGNYRRID